MKRLGRLAGLIIGAALGLLFYCGSFYVKSFLQNREAQQSYESLRDICLTGESTGEAEAVPPSPAPAKKKALRKAEKKQETSADSSAPEKKEKIRESFGISWEKLWEINAGTVAWITVPGTGISYPVVQGEDDEYYLHHSIEGEEDVFGTIYLGCGNDREFQDSHSLLYGHNMEGDMMFASLNRYEKKEFLEECPEFYIITPEKMLRYEIFSVEQAGQQSPGFQYGHALGSRAYETQLKILSESSMYDCSVSVDAEMPMVTLVTCNSRLDEDIRMTVHGICREVIPRE